MTRPLPRVAVLQGGPAAEAAVSRVSAAGVAEALSRRCSAVACVEVDAGLVQALADFAPDVVFPALHGPPGEDGTVQGLLEMLGLPYVGSDVRASACAMDKFVAKQIFRAAGLPMARDEVVRADEPRSAAIERVLASLGSQVVVKPTRQGSALGVSRVSDAAALDQALATALDYDELVLVEERVLGRELTVGVLETRSPGHQLRLLPHPVIEITTPAGSWYDYHHRYTPGESAHEVPARVPEEATRQLQEIAVNAHRWLGCRDLSRADFLYTDDGRIVLLEVNTMPGMTPTSLYPDGARALGIEFPELVWQLVENARNRSA